MGSYRSVIAVFAIAAALWAVVAVTRPAPTRATDVRVALSVLEKEPVATITVARGERVTTIERRDEAFVVGDLPADPDVIDALVTTLQYAYSRRVEWGAGHAERLGLAAAQASLTVEAASGKQVTLRRGRVVADDALVWIGRGDDALLITATEAGLLFPEPDTVLTRRLFRFETRALDSLVYEQGGSMLTLRRADPAAPIGVVLGAALAPAEPSVIRELAGALRALVLEPGGDTKDAPPRSLSILAGGRQSSLRITGTCNDARLAVESPLGAGCVASAPFDRLAALAVDPSALLAGVLDGDRTVSRIKILSPRSFTIEVKGDGAEAAARWLSALRSVDALVETPDGAPAMELEVHYESGDPRRVTLSRTAAGVVVAAAGQPGRRLSDDAAETVLGARPFMFRRRDLSSRDPSEILSVRVGARAIDVGALPGPARAALAHLEAERFVAERATRAHALSPPRRVIEVRFSPPPIATGDRDRIAIELGATLADGRCYARLGAEPVVFTLASTACAALSKL